MKKKPLKIVLGLVLCIVAFFFVMMSAQVAYERDIKRTALGSAEMAELELNSSLDGEISMVLKMASSPVVRRYFENPSDPLISTIAIEEFDSFQQSFLSKSDFWMTDVDKDFYSDGKYAYHVDVDLPENYWWHMTMNQKEDYNFNINYNPDIDQIQLWLNATVRRSNGTAIGMCGTSIPLSDFINKMYDTLGSGVNMYLYNDTLKVTGAKDSSLVEKEVPIENVVKGIDAAQLAYDTEIKFIHSSKAFYLIYPLEKLGWAMVIETPISAGSLLSKTATPLIVLIVIFVIWMMVSTVRNVIKPLVSIHGTVDELSTGNADLTRRIEVKESGTLKIIINLVASFNSFLVKLQEIISNVINSKGLLVKTGTNLNQSIEDASAAITQITANIQSIGNNVRIQSEAVNSTSSAVSLISKDIASLNNMIETQSSGVTQASATVEQMIFNINSVNNSVTKLTKSFAELKDKSNEGVSKQQDVNDRIAEIKAQSEMLQEANQMISAIAEQTNLLAMNAAIEAAHAGEAGKGFSVVADEIRKLSETSSAQSKTIGEQLKTIQDSIMNIVTVSSDSQKVFSEVTQEVMATDSLVEQIGRAMEEQTMGSKQITEALQLLISSADEVKRSSEEITEENKNIHNDLKNLQNSTDMIREGMKEMAEGATKINETSVNLTNIAGDVNDSITLIGSQIDLFQV